MTSSVELLAAERRRSSTLSRSAAAAAAATLGKLSALIQSETSGITLARGDWRIHHHARAATPSRRRFNWAEPDVGGGEAAGCLQQRRIGVPDVCQVRRGRRARMGRCRRSAGHTRCRPQIYLQ